MSHVNNGGQQKHVGDDVPQSGHTYCSLCKKHLKNAVTLPVCQDQHAFCFHCLETHTQGRRTFPCPTCKSVVDLPLNNVMIDNGGGGSSSPAGANNYPRRLLLNGGGGTQQEQQQHQIPKAVNLVSKNNSPHSGLGRNTAEGSIAAVMSSSTQSSAPKLPPGWAPSQDLMSDPTWRKAPESIWKNPFNLGGGGDAAAAAACSPGDNGWQPMAGLSSPSWSAVIGSRVERVAPNMTHGSNGVSETTTVPVCSSCEDKHVANSHCRNCGEDLCQDCVVAHQRVKLTRDHVIMRFSDNSSKPFSKNLASVTEKGKSLSVASLSTAAPNNLLSSVQSSDVMRVYADAVESAKADIEGYKQKTKQGMAQIEEANRNVSEMEVRINARHGTVLQEIKAISQKHQAAIREREQLLITRLDSIRQVKLKTLEKQKQSLSHYAARLRSVYDKLQSSRDGGAREMALIDACKYATDNLRDIHNKCGSLNVNEDAIFEFLPPDPALLLAMAEVGYISGSGFGPSTLAEGDGLKKGILGKDARFIVAVRDQLNEKRLAGNDPVKVTIVSPEGRQVRSTIYDGQNGTYRVIWKPLVEGEHVIAVTIKDVDIHGSPFKAIVRSGRNYQDIGQRLFEFGGEGEQDGQLCRPWGICCSKEGYILVANRSNNRIEVYARDGTFHHKFGATGKLNGQFDRPASVCCDSMNRAIVTDKDNHRIQIFTVEGEFLMAFGERGSKPGQFNYPWDVACNSKDQILVSDTRNHRVQLFTPNGEFLTKYGFDGAMWKHFDSPRGVCFTASDQAVVTDFNNHRLLVVKSDFQTAQFLGKEGIEDGMFTRPNGVVVDEEGHIIVADSRNDRIQIFSSSGVFITKFGTKGSGPGEFDRPSGICISPEGHLIVVDFGNNRCQVF